MKMNTNGMRRRATAPLRARLVLEWLVMGVLALLVSGCSLEDLLGNEKLPETVTDPAITKTPKGALRAYYGTVSAFRGTFDNVVRFSGRLTDELQALSSTTSRDSVDMRDLPEKGSPGPYGFLHKVRGQAMQAIGLQRDFAPDSLAALTGHLYALQAYAEIFLADLYCSGIPLSTLDYDGDYTYRPGSTTEQVYEHAIALLDTALTQVGDSVSFKRLAQIGRARALLNLGRFADAAAAVAEVPDNFRYATVNEVEATGNVFSLNTAGQWGHMVGDLEGINGLDYRTSADPRTQTSPVKGSNNTTVQFPAKYTTNGLTPIVLASGIEARLIEAEAALRLNAGDPTWLDKLNHLRQTMWTTIVPAVAGPLPNLADPGTDVARVDLLYRERAFWLFLTGQRQGDLRRLVRHYGRMEDQVYPTGPYMGVPGLWYGSHMDLPVWESERVSNPYYNGCFTRS